MKEYKITAKAGRFVAGQNNTGNGTSIWLSDRQAAHELRLGSIVAVNGEEAKKPSRRGKAKPASKTAGKIDEKDDDKAD